MSEDKKIDIDAILMRLSELEEQANEVSRLRQIVNDMKSIATVGESVAAEVNQEIVHEVEALRLKNIHIPFLTNKSDDIRFVRRGKAGKNATPLMESEIIEVQKTTTSAWQAARKLGVSYPTYRKYCKRYNLIKVRDKNAKRDNIGPVNPFKGKYSLSKILDGKYPDFPIHRLKDKLIRSGIKKGECHQCGYKERRLTDGKIPLLLNFEDCDSKNHKVENLTILCYNCTFICGRGYIKRGTAHINLDPDVMQGATNPLKARF